MTTKELAARLVETGMESLFRSARAMPEDKLTWRAGEDCRTALEYLQECAQSLKWPETLLNLDKRPLGPEAFEAARQERAGWTSLQACEDAARANLPTTLAYIRDYPEGDLDRVIELPFMPDLKMTVLEILCSPYWNATYHLGQINFIQLMYGDKEMH